MQDRNVIIEDIRTTKSYDSVKLIYILYCIGYFTGWLTAIVGVVLAYVKKGETTDPVALSHYRSQIRLFWYSLVWLCIGGALTIIGVGFIILVIWFVWSLYRVIKGFSSIAEGRAID